MELSETDILTRVTKYNLIRAERMLHIDIHESIHGKLAGRFVAVPNLINIIAKPEYQGTGDTEQAALEDCLTKIKGIDLVNIFPERPNPQEQENSD